jgi:tetratricopeptide (TPR) repeat protein
MGLAAMMMAIILVASGALALVRPEASAPTRWRASSSDAAALAHVGASDLRETITVLREHLGTAPEDARSWASLGLAYIEQARTSGDTSLYLQATRALGRSLRVQPHDNSVALAGQAALAAARHDFTGALTLSRAALAINPYEVGALSIRVDALTELGRYPAAMRALSQADRRKPSAQIFARYSYAEEMRGHTGRAKTLLQRALTGVTNTADKAFLMSLLADLERRDGNLSRAAADLRLARVAEPDHVPALAGQARLAVARGHLETAAQRWRRVVRLSPSPGYLLELGQIYQATGRAAAARAQYRNHQESVRAEAATGVSTEIDAARFLADHGSPTGALQAARAAYQQAPSIWAADALAWALHRSGRDHAALRSSTAATRLGTPDPMLWVHRGFIEVELGRSTVGEQHVRHGLSLDPGLNPWHADNARRLLDRLRGAPD